MQLLTPPNGITPPASCPPDNFWTGIHNPTNGGNATMPPVFVADGFDAQGNDRAGTLVIQDLNKHPNTNGSLGVAWDAIGTTLPFCIAK